MQTMNLEIPDYLKIAMNDICKDEKISLNQFILNALNEKISALQTIDIIEEKAKKASKEDFLNALNQIPNNKPLKNDEL